MSPFLFTSNLENGIFHLKFMGFLDEHAKLPESLPDGIIEISLKELLGINSTGTRVWCKWMKQVAENHDISLIECPPTLVKCFNQVKGSLIGRTQVRSFFVPFYSDITGERSDILFVPGVHCLKSSVIQAPIVLDSQKNLMEMDVFPDYFRFLAVK